MIKALACAFVIAATLAVTSAQEPLAVGLMRVDGYLIPLATITSQQSFPSVPTSLLNNSSWTLFYRDDRPSVGITTSTRTSVESHCEPQVVWRTSLDMPPIDPRIAPAQKIGLAVRGGVIEQARDVLARADEDSARVAARIPSIVNDKERDSIAGDTDLLPCPRCLEAARSATPVEIEVLQRDVIDGRAVYYFEAQKKYFDLGGEQVRIRGWIIDTPNGVTVRHLTYQLDDDSHKHNDRMTVWGVIKTGKRSLWVMEGHGYEWEYYRIREWPSGALRFEMSGGGC